MSTTQTQVIASSSPSTTTNTNNTNDDSATIGQHFKVGKKIGEGSFGVVFEGINIINQSPVAIKFEPRKSDAPQLRDEYRSYRILNGIPGIPQVHYFGQEGLHNVLVLDLFGPNLEDLFDMCGRKFTVKCVCMLAKQMITRVQSIHDKSLIYRDIKPDNFLTGPPSSPKSSLIHIIDFGMAKHYRDPRSHQHIPYRERKSLSGTARYMSINTHLGREQSRRDDLESLGHVFMYFLRGGLPWQGLKAATNKQKYEKIGMKKESTSVAELCEGFPEEFQIYLSYVRKLGFEEAPDYDFLRSLFTKVLEARGETDDGVFDWMVLNNGRGWEANTGASGGALLQAHIKAGELARESGAGSRGGEMPPGVGVGVVATPRRRHQKDKEREARHRERAERERERDRERELGAGMGVALPTAAAKKAPLPHHLHHARNHNLPIGGGDTPNTSASMNPIPPASRRASASALHSTTPTHPYASTQYTSAIASGQTRGIVPNPNSNSNNKPLPSSPQNGGAYTPVEAMRIGNGGGGGGGTGNGESGGDGRKNEGFWGMCCR